LGPWSGYTGKPIGADQISARGLAGGEGEVRGKVQELTTIKGWPVLGKRGIEVAYRRRTGRAAELRGTSIEFRWLEGRRTAGKWLDSFYATTWCWWGAWLGLRGGGSMGGQRG
jgi:hypothetical protein